MSKFSKKIVFFIVRLETYCRIYYWYFIPFRLIAKGGGEPEVLDNQKNPFPITRIKIFAHVYKTPILYNDWRMETFTYMDSCFRGSIKMILVYVLCGILILSSEAYGK